MRESHVSLPRGRQFALTWSIPEPYRGMTTALLRRSRAFTLLGGVPVDVLTFDPELDSAAAGHRLRSSGELIDGMRLLNLYDWFLIHPRARGCGRRARPGAPPVRTAAGWPRWADAGAHRRRRTVLQVDHYRSDGTIVVSDRRDVAERGTVGGRSVVLCDAHGRPVRSWGRIWGLYRFWLDELRRREPSFFIVDSKTMAPFAMSYRRKRAVMLHLVHNSHLAGSRSAGSAARVSAGRCSSTWTSSTRWCSSPGSSVRTSCWALTPRTIWRSSRTAPTSTKDP